MKQIVHFLCSFLRNLCIKADCLSVQSCLHNLFQTVKGTATDKQNIGGINTDKLLMGMLSASLRRNTCHSTLHNFQKCLLYTLTGYISGNGHIFTLLGNFINFIDVNNAVLGTLHIIICRLNQL